MIADVFDVLEEQAADPTNGVNARISALNAELSLAGLDAVPALKTIQTWGQVDQAGDPRSNVVTAQLPQEMEMPALVFGWMGTPEVQAKTTEKRRAKHRIRLYWYDVESDQRRARKHMGHMTKVLVRFLEGIEGIGTVAAIGKISFDPKRWLMAGQGDDVSRMEGEFEISERDETP